ncbi:MAG: M23 family metallopeptidase [bacterium]
MTATPRRFPVRPAEVFGLDPLAPALRQCKLALLGDPHSPKSRWGPSSLRIFKPRVGVPLWLGRPRADRRVVITQLPNRVPPPPDAAYSVRATFARDYRGRRLSYDGHVGTDFAIPPGTAVVAPAAGLVRLVENRMERGGLKVALDHGDGLATTLGHLARALVQPGDRVARGDVVGLSGMSGVDGVLFFPWLAPHVHMNVLLDGAPVDPFAAPGETPIWRAGNHPLPAPAPALEDAAHPTTWDHDAIDATLATCRDPVTRAEIEALTDPDDRAFRLMIRRLFRGYLFTAPPRRLTARAHARRPRLDLPFAARDYDGVLYVDGEE